MSFLTSSCSIIKRQRLNRDEGVMDLNKAEIDGLIISPQVGGVGHTLYDANNMIFMDSLYSMSEESQTIGILIFYIFTDFSRENVSRGTNP